MDFSKKELEMINEGLYLYEGKYWSSEDRAWQRIINKLKLRIYNELY